MPLWNSHVRSAATVRENGPLSLLTLSQRNGHGPRNKSLRPARPVEVAVGRELNLPLHPAIGQELRKMVLWPMRQPAAQAHEKRKDRCGSGGFSRCNSANQTDRSHILGVSGIVGLRKWLTAHSRRVSAMVVSLSSRGSNQAFHATVLALRARPAREHRRWAAQEGSYGK